MKAPAHRCSFWFYAIFKFTKTRHGVSAKELERELGVTYKCAWRMAKMIRQHMAEIDGDDPLGSEGEIVEIDEAYVGGEETGYVGRGNAQQDDCDRNGRARR